MSIDFDDKNDDTIDEFSERFESYTEPPPEDAFDDRYDDDADPDGDLPPGSPLTAEAMRLVASLQDWVRRTAAQTPDGHTGPDCQWCPLCQFVAVLRGERPEVTERVAEAGTAIATALRSLLDATAGAGAHRAEDREPPADETPDGGRVQRITLGESFGQV